MIKILGMMTVLLSAWATGFVMAKELEDRTKLLKEIHQNAIYIRSDMEYRRADIQDCFFKRGKLFSNAYYCIKEKSMLPENALIKSCEELPFLSRDDKDIVIRYAKNLNKEDLGGQVANVSWLIENIGQRIKDSENEYRSKSRLYKSGGAIMGFGLIILLL